MNHIFRVVFNRVLGCWQAVTELAKSSGKVGGAVKRRAVKLAAVAAVASGANAGLAQAQTAPAPDQLPQGGNVAAGQAQINQSGNVMNIDQSTQKAIINWNEFNVGQDARVNFNQPNSSAATLNRVMDANPSQIFGQIVAPGQVILINPNGAYFAPSASVDVGGLIATTHELADKDFLDGNYEFTRNGATGKIINEGELKAKLDGYIALMAPEVRNQGVIVAERGTVVLAAGEHIQLDFGTGHKLQGITVTEQDLDAQIENKHAILAEGGLVILSAKATAELRASVIKNSGQIVASAGANTVTMEGGRIILDGGATGEVQVSGELMAQSTPINTDPANPTQPQGGEVEITAKTVEVTETAKLDVSGDTAGKIKIDAKDTASIDGVVAADSAQDRGGLITVEADHITLKENAVLTATGKTGGGDILVGGDWQGGKNEERRVFENPDAIRESITVNMKAGATIDASATDNGDGGTVVLWSDIQNPDSATRVYGSLLAEGGANSGDGGQIETSGFYLDALPSSVSASAPNGKRGEWLLDPYNIVISSSTAGTSFSSSGVDYTYMPLVNSTILASSIVTALNAGTNVTVSTGLYGSAGGSVGDITVNSAINATTANGGDMTLEAARNIVLNASLTTVGAMTFAGDVKINAPSVSLSTMGGGSTGSDIIFTGDIDGASANSNSLFILSGAGAISVAGGVGGNTALKFLGLGGTGQYIPGDVENFYYSSSGTQTYTALYTGVYKLEVWGAEGSAVSGSSGGRGAYAVGNYSIAAGNSVYVYVGSKHASGGWNGGASGGTGRNSNNGAGGGGATDIRTTSGAWNNTTSRNSRVIVAGGGGGAGGNGQGGGSSNKSGSGGSGGAGGLSGTSGDADAGKTDGLRGLAGGLSSGGSGGSGRTETYSKYDGNYYPAGGGGGGGGYYGGGGGGGGGIRGSVFGTNVSVAGGSGSQGGLGVGGSGGAGANPYLGWASGAGGGGGGGSSYVGRVSNGYTRAGNLSMPSPTSGTIRGNTGHGKARITITESTTFNPGDQSGSISIGGAVNTQNIRTASGSYDIALGTDTGNVSVGTSATFNNSGTLQLGSSAGTQTVSVSGALTATAPSVTKIGADVTTSTTQRYNGAELLKDVTLNTTNNLVSFNGGIDSAAKGAHDLTINAGSGAINVSGAMGAGAGAGSNAALGDVTLNSTGATTLGSAVTAGSVTTNSGGTLAIDGGSVTTTGNQSYGETLTLGADTTFDTADLTAAAINLSSNTLTAEISGTGAVNGIISGNGGGFTKDGEGGLTLSGDNTYSGATVINAGTLVADHVDALGSTTGNTTVNAGGTLDLSNVALAAEPLVLDGGTLKDSTSSWGGTIDLSANSTFDIQTGDTLTVTGVISGTGRLTKVGDGTVVLSNASNTYAGGTALEAGVLSISADGNLGAIPGSVDADNLTLAGGTLKATAGFTLDSNRGISLGAGGGTIEIASSTVTYAGVVADAAAVVTAGGLTKTGNGTLVLAGDNTYSGGTTISTGTLQVGNGSSSGSLGTGAIVNNATLVFDRTGALTVSGLISGTGGLTQAGTGTVTLTGNNTFDGGVNLDDGVLALGSADAIGSAGTIDFDGGVLRYTTDNTTDYSGRLTTASSTPFKIDTNGQEVTFANALVSTGGSLTKLGAGTLTLSGANSYDGATSISDGTLTVSGTLSNDTAVTVSSGAVYNVDASDTIGSLAGSGVVATSTAGDKILTVGGSDTNTTFDGVIEDGGGGLGGLGTLALVKDGNGTLTLAGDNTYSGGTTISSGTVQVGNGSSSGSLGTGAIENNATLVFDRAGALTIGALISGTGGLTQAGTGTLTLTGNNTFAGAVVLNYGALVIGHVNALGTDTSTLSITSGATLGLQGDITLSRNIDLADGAGVGAIRNVSGNNTLSGTITLATGDNEIVADAGTLSFTGAINSSGSPVPDSSLTLSGAGGIAFGQALEVKDFTSTVASLGLGADLTAYGDSSGIGVLSIAGDLTTTGDVTIHNKGTWYYGTSSKLEMSGNVTAGGDLTLWAWQFDVASNIDASGQLLTVQQINTGSNSNAITLAGQIQANELAVVNGQGATIDISNVANNIGTFAVDQAGDLTLSSATALTIGAVNPSGVNASGDVLIETLTGDLTISESIVSTSNSAVSVELVAGKNTAAGTSSGGDIKIANGATITVASGSQARLFTGSLSGSTGVAESGTGANDGLVEFASGHFRYNADETTDFTDGTWADLTDSGLYAIYREQPTITATLDDQTIVYGTTTPSFNLGGGVTLVNGDSTNDLTIVNEDLNQSGAGFLKAGNYVVTAAGLGALGYDVADVEVGSLVVQTKTITVNSLTAQNKTYDGTAVASLSSNGSLDGVKTNDDVTFSTAATFNSKNVEATKTLDLDYTLSGNDIRNYVLVDETGVATDALIEAKTVSLSAVKVYDGTTDLTGAVTINTGVTVNGTPETLTYTNATSDSANVAGSDNNVATADNFISSITLGDATGATDSSGGLASNYQLPTLDATDAPVTTNPLVISLTAPTATKTYDGNDSYTVTSADLIALTNSVTLATGESIAAATVTYDDRHVGAGNKTVTLDSVTVSSDNSNYDITLNGNSTGTINQLTSASWIGNDGDLWSDASNWAWTDDLNITGALPDGSNVALAVIDFNGTVLSNAASNYTGNIRIDSGTLSVASDSYLGATTSTAVADRITLAGGTLKATAGFTLNSNRGISLDAGGGTIEVDSAQTFVIDGVVADTAGLSAAAELTKAGAGTLVLAGENTYSGGTTIDAGTLQVGSGSSTGSLGTGAIANNAALVFNRTDPLTIGAAISGSGTLTQAGTGTLTLTGNNTFDGGVNLDNGVLELGSSGAIGTTGTIDFDGGVFRYTVDNTTDYSARLTTDSNTPFKIDTNGQDVSFANTLASSSGSLTKLGAGTLTLSSATYSGATIIDAGRLVLKSDTASFTSSGFSGAGVLAIEPVGLSFTSPVTLSNTEFNALGGVALGKSGNQTEIVVNTDIALDGSLEIYGPLSLGGSITTGSTQTYDGAVTITAADASLSTMGNGALGSDIIFTGDIDGTTADSNSLFMLSGAGAISVAGGVGSNTALAYLGFGGMGGKETVSATFNYTGSSQSYTTTFGAVYTLEVWGAQGGGDYGGRGGYSKGNLSLANDETIHIYVGGQGSVIVGGLYTPEKYLTGGWNGGGGVTTRGNSTSAASNAPSTGGGGTDIRVGGTSLGSRVIVAGGGGGGGPFNETAGGDGGGSQGVGGRGDSSQGTYDAQGGTQTAGGAHGTHYGVNYVITDGSLGKGGDGSGNTQSGRGGGGGYYGGGGGAGTLGGGGGSGYIGGVDSGTMTVGGRSGNGKAVITAEATVFDAGTQTGSISIGGSVNVGALDTAGTNFDIAMAQTSGDVTLSSDVTFNNTGNVQLGGGASGQSVSVTGELDASAAALTKIGADITTDNAQTYAAAELLGNATLSTTNSAVNVSGAMDTAAQGAHDLTINAGSGAINLSGAVGAGVNGSLGDVTLNSTGATTLGGAVTAGSVTTNSGGTLVIDGGSVTTTGNQSYGEILTLGAHTTFDTADLTAAAINLSTYDLTADVSGTGSVTGSISGSGDITKAGDGTLTLSGSSSYDGATWVNDGTLAVGHASALGSTAGNTEVAAGATLDLLDVAVASEALVLDGGTLKDSTSSWGGTIDLSANSTFDIQTGDTLTVTGVISGTGRLTKVGDGTVVLSNASNIYEGGTALEAGVLSISADGNLGAIPGSVDADNLTIAGGTLKATAGFTLNSNRGISLGAGTIEVGSAHTLVIDGVVADAAGLSAAAELTKTNTGTLVLAGDNTYSGGTTISDGTVQVGNGSSSGSLGTGAIVNNATLVFDRTGALTVSGLISGTGGLTQAGTGTVTLTGANSFGGQVLIDSGTLVAADNSAFGSGASTIDVSVGATLGLQGDITLSRDIELANGTGFGTVRNVSGDNTLSGAITLASDDNAVVADAGTLRFAGAVNSSASPFADSSLTLSGAGGVAFDQAVEVKDFTSTVADLTLGGNLTAVGDVGGTFIGVLSITGDLTTTGDVTIHNKGTRYFGTSSKLEMSGNVTADGDLTLWAWQFDVASDIDASGQRLTIQPINNFGSHNAPITLAGQIQVNELTVVNGQGANIDISNVTNNIGTFAVDQAGDLTLISGTALTLGSVNPTGITATGDVFVATVNGDLTIAEDITTSSTSATAMVLAAGTSASAGGDGTPSAGNVVIGTTSTNTTPSLSVGTSGTIGVYTGGMNGSSGLASLVSQGDFRYNTSITSSGVVTAGYTMPLATDAVNAIYREQPVLTVVIDDAVIDYSYSPNNTLSSLAGFVNGDTQANALNSVSFTVTPGAAGTSSISGNLNVGDHDIRLSSATNPLGYDIQDTAAKLTVNQLASATWGGGNGNWSDPTNWFVTGTNDSGALPDGNNVALAVLPTSFTGTLISDVDHGHQGKIAIEGGVLSVGSDLRLGAVPGAEVPDLITIAGSGKLQASAGFTINANRGVVLAAPAGVSDTGARGIEVTTATLTIEGPVSGGGNLTKTGAGALALENAANSYGGGTAVDAGELVVVQTADVLGSGNLTLNNGAVLSATESNGQPVTISQDIDLPSGTATISVPFGGRTDLVLNGNISGAGGLTIASDFSGRWAQFGGNNTYAGGTTIGGATNNNARVRVASDTPLGTGAVAIDYSSTGGAQLTFMGNHTLANDISIVTGDTLTVGTNGNNATLAGVISGTNAILRKVDAGTLTLSNTNTYSGATTIDAGVLVIANNTPTTASSGFGGTGQLRIEPGMNSSSFASGFTSTGWTISNTLTGLTIGRLSNTADVTFTSPIAINGPMTIYGGDITVAGSSTDLTLQAAGQVVFDGMTVTGKLLSTTGGTAAAGGVSQTGVLQVTGTSTFTADGGTDQVALLAEPANNFVGAVSFVTANGGSWQDVTLVDGIGGLVLGDIDATGTFTVTSTGGAITQQNATRLMIGGESKFTASKGASPTPTLYDITLDSATNDFGGVVNATGDNIELADGTDGIALGNIDASGTLAVTSTDGAVTQEQGSSITVTGITTLTAANATDVFDITLGEGSNDFGAGINARGDSITLVDGMGGLVLGDIDAAGTFTATSTAGAITQQSGTNLMVGGESTFTASNGAASTPTLYDITLGSTTNDFGVQVDVSGATVTLRDVNGLLLGGINASGSISVFGADITLAAALIAGANSDIVVSATDNFYNTQGADSLNVSGTGRWVVYIGNARGNDYGGLDSQNEAVWNENYNTMAPGAVPSGNRYVFDQDAIRRVVVESTDATKVYGETIDLNNNYTLVATGVSGVDGAYLGTNSASSVTAGQVFSANPTFAATGEVATADVGVSTIVSKPGTANTLFDVVYQDLGELTVTARPIELTATADTKTYGDLDPTLVYTTEATSVGRGLVSGDVFTGTVQRASGEDVGTYAINQGTIDNPNYAISWTSNDLAITPRPITLTADRATKVYGENDLVFTYGIEALGASRGLVGNDTFTGSASRPAGEDVGNYAIGQGTVDDANYDITWSSNDLTITPRAITLAADSATKVYGDVDPTLSVSIVGGSVATAMGETLADVTGTVTRESGENVGVYDTVLGQGAKAANYAITFEANNNAFEIERARLVATGSKVYDGSILFAGQDLTIVGVNGETFAGAGDATMGTKNVQTGQPLASLEGFAVSQTGNGLFSNYEGLALSDTAVSVTARPVMLSATQTTKTYDGTMLYEMKTGDLNSLSANLVGGDSVVGADLMFDSKDVSRDGNGNVLSNRVVTLSDVQIDDGNAGGNYQVTIIDANDGRINPAPLTVTAVNDAKFVTQADPSGYMGAVYTGFVGGETEASSGVQPGQLTRSNAGQNSAGTYTDVLVASTDWRANNYEITFEAGDFTVVPADTLLVRAPALDSTYGEALPEFNTVTAQYLDSADNQIKTLAVNYNTTTNLYSTTDGVGSNATFGFAIDNAPLSTAGFAQTGGYNVAPDTNTTFSGNNFQDLVMVGALTVAPKTLANNLGINEVSKVYDGNRSIAGLDLNFDGMTAGVISGDLVSLVGNGAYADRNVGTDKAVNLSLALRGEDANNYRLTTPTYSANVGTITQRESVTWVGQAGGSWSDSRNWEDGALPDGNNVGRVVIPQEAQVFYNSDLVGATTSAIENNGTIRFASNNAFTFANAVSGAGSLEQRDTGLLTVAGNSTFTGETDIGNYALEVASTNALGAGKLVSDGGTLSVTNGVTLAGLSVTGPITLATSVVSIGNQTYEGPITLATGNRQSPLTMQSVSGDVTLNGTVSAGVNAKGAQRSLSLQGDRVTIAGQIGMPVKGMLFGNYQGTQDTNPYALTVTGNEIYLLADVTTFEEQRYVGPVLIGDNGTNGTTRTLISVDPSVTFTDTVDAVDEGVHGLDVRAYTMAMALNETPTITFEDAVGQTRALADLYVDVGVQNQSPVALVATPAPNQPPMIGQVTLGGDVATVGSQTYRGNRVVLGDGQTLTLSARSGTVDIIAGRGANAGVVGLERLQLAFGDFTEVGGGLGGLLSDANINLNQILARTGLYSNALSSPLASLAGSTDSRLAGLFASQQTAGTLEVDANRPSSVLLSGEVEVGEIDSLDCSDSEILQADACVPAGDE